MRVSPFAVLFCVMAGLVLNACTPDTSFPSPLEDVFVNEQTFESQETTERVIEVTSLLTDVKAVAYDMATKDAATWLTVGIASRKIKLKLTKNDSPRNRTAHVYLYYAGSRSDVRDTDLTVEFYVKQKGLDVK